jgi:ribonuclease HI
MKSFVVPISDETRRLKRLKFRLYTDGNKKQNKGCWSACSIDTKEKTFYTYGVQTCEDTSECTTYCDHRMELISIIEGLKWILSSFDEETQKHVQIQVYSDSVYAINLAREWIGLWSESKFENRPNKDLCLELESLLEKAQIKFEWCSQDGNEWMKECKRLSLEQL